jgi:hypothetical protein
MSLLSCGFKFTQTDRIDFYRYARPCADVIKLFSSLLKSQNKLECLPITSLTLVVVWCILRCLIVNVGCEIAHKDTRTILEKTLLIMTLLTTDFAYE